MDELIHASIIKLISIIETTSSRTYSILNTIFTILLHTLRVKLHIDNV